MLKKTLLLVGLLCLFQFAQAKGGGDDKFEAKDFSELITHHIADSHGWEFFKGFTIPLPVILYTDKGLDIFMSSAIPHGDGKHEDIKKEGHKEGAKAHDGAITFEHGGNKYVYAHGHFALANGGHVMDFSITKNVASLFVSVALLFFVFFSVSKGYKKRAGKAPRGIQSFFEPIIIFVRDDIAKENIGPKYERFTPYLLTVFFFIWFNNMLGLLPGAANLTGNIAVTLVLSVITFVITTLSANKNYWAHIFTPPVPKLLYIILVPIEIIGMFTKPFSLMIRLFANITAGHIIMLSLFGLIFIFQSLAVGVVSTAFATFMNFLELLVAFIQAYVFTLLSASYFSTAVEEHHHDEAHAHAH
ncbi:F0F1 ATP synthase subunit A [uncultured Microscilla sp.]|uniref:F0F1 ATP synthase subunit A n=1 Tax=uncultured Microscilla sp. TaxID=432653 RepID=UPI00260EED6E|nr:F0F1 ATP synthase subunit A [uncultured Microscilla sp.]